MIYNIAIGLIISFSLTLIFLLIGIPILKKIKAGQPVLGYVKEHKNKNGTPTMGGIFFILAITLTYAFFGVKGRLSLVIIVVTLAFFVVGLLDDFLKVKSHENEGLKAYQKIIFQFIISLFVGVFAYVNKITMINIPYFNISVDFGIWIIPFSMLVLIGATNAVNLTDGLDGLSSSVTVTYLIFFALILVSQSNGLSLLLKNNEYVSMITTISLLVGSLLAFLIFNTSKASVFMGDTGSLSLGGFVGTLAILTSNSLILLVLGFAYIISIISVVIQVLYYKKTKRRIFLMAPYHHHLQMKGLSESKIAYIYSLITCIIGLSLVISYF